MSVFIFHSASLSLSLSLTHTHTHIHIHTHSLPLSLTYTRSLPLSHIHTLSPSLSFSNIHFPYFWNQILWFLSKCFECFESNIYNWKLFLGQPCRYTVGPKLTKISVGRIASLDCGPNCSYPEWPNGRMVCSPKNARIKKFKTYSHIRFGKSNGKMLCYMFTKCC